VPKEVVLRAPCCKFEPRVLAMREGTKLVFRQTDRVPHNLKLDGEGTPQVGQLIPADRVLTIEGIRAARFPASACCTIHPWMKAWVGVFHHPYFAVTDPEGRFTIKDAPAGRWRLVLWHESSGFFPYRNREDVGVLISVRGGKTTNVGEVKFTEVD
jgi:hypothetical protein